MTTLQQLSEHTWIFPHKSGAFVAQPNVGIVSDGNHTILIDAGNGQSHAAQIKTAVSNANLAPVSQIIFTHHHWDHVFGACVFEATVIANQRSVSLLEQMAKQPWSDAYLQEWEKRDSRRQTQALRIRNAIRGNWSNFSVALPHLVFDQYHTIELPNITLFLQYVGGAHASDSITVRVCEENILFIGDSYYPAPEYERACGEAAEVDLDIMEEFLSSDVETYIDGHNPPFTGRQMRYMVRFAQHSKRRRPAEALFAA